MSVSTNTYPVVCFGEILWDFLPTGSVPGGAPMNVAYHLKKLGINPAMITRIGLDDWGKKLITIMESNMIHSDFFQLDYELVTGCVNATIGENNEVSYDIVKPVAWDAIQMEIGFEDLVKQSEYFVFGSLATRSYTSRNTLFKLLEYAKVKVLDINLRAPYYNRKLIEVLLTQAHILKLNLEELELITGWFTDYNSDADRIRVLQDKFDIRSIVVTKGGDGAIFNCDGKIYEHPGIKVKVADTVGSGDAFLAGLLSKLMINTPAQEALEFASGMGAFVATKNGACPDYVEEDVYNLIKEKNNQNAI